MMRKLLVFTLLAVATFAMAQENKYVIRGSMTSSTLCYSEETVKEVKLEQTIDGVPTVIATANVENGEFVFEGTVPGAVSLCSITGFDNGSIQFFLEEGEINVGPFDAAYPVGSRIGGTPSNDTYQAYLDLNNKCIEESKVRMRETYANLPEEIKGNQEAELRFTSPTFYVNNMHFKVAIMDFIYQNIDSPVILYVIKYAMVPTFNSDVIQGFLTAVPDELHKHAMYKELVNDIRSANLKVGSAAPDISGRTPEGKELSLSDFKGKYVFIDFWASWCAPCRREIPYLKEALAYSENSDDLVVLSYSIDNEMEAWIGCIDKSQLIHKNWVHISTLKGWNSDGIRLFGVNGVPFTALIDPDGNIVQFELRGEEMVKKLKSIVDGANK
ncbi:MAG: AhpC/TSA family protein [Bacteroidaceae bacterium]|nr:AhpC/TSA family protein [Bacteroidaceae bacterium]